MKKTFIECGLAVCGIMFLAAGPVSAQDVIVLNNKTADEIEAKVVEVSREEVKYKKWSYQDGPTFTLSTDEIFVIKYRNGEKQTFFEQMGPEPAPEAESVSQSGSKRSAEALRRLFAGSGNTGADETSDVSRAHTEHSSAYIAPKPKTSRWPDFKPHVEGGIFAGYTLGIGDFAIDAIECLELRIGYRFNPYFFLGGSVSHLMFLDFPELYEDMPDSNGLIPILADFRGYVPLSEKVSLYADFGLGVNVGYGACDTDFTFMVGPGFKIGRFAISAVYRYFGEDAGAMSFRIGYTF